LIALKLPIVINQTCDEAAQTKVQQLANKVLYIQQSVESLHS
jgi:hypothetical protein